MDSGRPTNTTFPPTCPWPLNSPWVVSEAPGGSGAVKISSRTPLLLVLISWPRGGEALNEEVLRQGVGARRRGEGRRADRWVRRLGQSGGAAGRGGGLVRLLGGLLPGAADDDDGVVADGEGGQARAAGVRGTGMLFARGVRSLSGPKTSKGSSSRGRGCVLPLPQPLAPPTVPTDTYRTSTPARTAQAHYLPSRARFGLVAFGAGMTRCPCR